MKYYIDITLLPDPETDLYFLWQKVYQQIHLALVESKHNDNETLIALSFPKYVYSKHIKHLGNKLRILANLSDELEKLELSTWLERLSDYVHITTVRNVPDEVTEHVCFTRKHIKGEKRRQDTVVQKAHYQSKKFGIPFDEALQSIKNKHTLADSTLPYIRVESLSNNKDKPPAEKATFPLFIEMKKRNVAKQGSYSCYGLSFSSEEKHATVPWF
ncbi:type I-F CRISPR-associated endoribonuclease Cas6/Csy4 [Flocculibacter collagenilyticus]|uniref:type I-F CRISPR-associated endoribonuclease Cas6/Csy4 n=1 Tax=Flocculibacter collagenilyticus TaxID=2744479 RepID=UPI0018F71718|nr:type I-F CRISPR-associated endoribonuclease Cas6/Csy4 [Flocculibacter collagenilyticus]